ncbi:unnamed protein product [Pocillopora meandrina]|uniref:G-protein coupled receptors family 1 profile domain-containing protein n=1 Tax=Pocillopora meandrina TaxID=46732 RepID=A0AAU9XR09_9CNID|nr:unnamed protein product [Pocillopora meandrina]
MSKNWLILLAKVNMLTITAISVDRLLALTLELSYRQVKGVLVICLVLRNCLVILALLKTTSLHPPSKVFLGSLALTDLCASVVSQPLYVMILLLRGELFLYLKIITSVSLTLFGVASLQTVTAISVDRLLALKMMLRYKQAVTLKRTCFTVVIFWLVSVIISIMVANYITIFHVICAVLLLCMVTSTFCYARIYNILRHHQNQIQVIHVQAAPFSQGSSPLIAISRYKKTVSSAIWVQGAFLACYSPYLFAIIFKLTGTAIPSFCFFRELSLSLVLLNSSLNPFIYCWKIDGVRKAAKDVIKSWC